MAFISGGYTATWNSLAMGQAADGYRLSHQVFKRIITGDTYAESPQDAVYRGAEASIQFTLIAYDSAAVQTLKWPYSATKWQIGTVGTTDQGSSLVKSLILTAVAGTPASATPATATFAQAILHESFPVEVLFAPNLRELPIRMRLYPSSGLIGVET